jgi:hypothetical protein
MLLLTDEAVIADPANVHTDPAHVPFRVEARAQPHPPAPRSPPRAALSLARERFAEKQASESRRAQ